MNYLKKRKERLVRNLIADKRGFTLLEVMVSVAILGIGVLTVMQLFSGGLRLAGAATDQTGTVLVAREKMSWALNDKSLTDGRIDGVEEDGYRWKVELSPYRSEVNEAESGLRVIKVDVSVTNPDGGKTYVLTSLKSVRTTL